MGVLKKIIYLFLIISFITSCVDTEFSSNLFSSSVVNVEVVSPQNTIYTPLNHFEFQWQTSGDVHVEILQSKTVQGLSLGSDSEDVEFKPEYSIKVFNNDGCKPDEVAIADLKRAVENISGAPNYQIRNKSANPLRENWAHEALDLKYSNGEPYGVIQRIHVNDLTDGDAVTFRVYSKSESGEAVYSKCSEPVYIDQTPPLPTTILYPVVDEYIGVDTFEVRYTASRDFGHANLKDDAYIVRLYDASNCQASSLIQEYRTSNLSYRFTNLTNTSFYSVGVQSEDKAGNLSLVSCSATIEVDTSVPILSLSDPSSTTGYSKTVNPDVVIGNAPGAVYFCLTENLGFIPTSANDTCPGGTGAFNGWNVGEPLVASLSSGDASKTVRLWAADITTSLISNRYGVSHITVDTTPLNDISILGVVGGQDSNVDAWLYSINHPEILIDPSVSTDAFEYEIKILDSIGVEVCAGIRRVHAATNFNFITCNLMDGNDYEAVLTGYDRALNETEERFSFRVDLTPPSAFTIVGVQNGLDQNLDGFLGGGFPDVHYTDSNGEFNYTIRVLDNSGNVICSPEVEVAGSLSHDFNLSPANTCSTLLDNEDYFVEVIAVDQAGNTTLAANSPFRFEIDSASPTVSFTSTPSIRTSEQAGVVSFTAVDAKSGLGRTECRIDGTSFSNCINNVSFAALNHGNHTVDIRATDNVGNVSVASYTWFIDTLNPVLSINSQPGAFTNSTNLEISFVATDSNGISGYTCDFNSNGFIACNNPWSQALGEGSYSVRIRAEDTVGLYSNIENVAFVVDRTDPFLNITPAIVNENAIFTFTQSDAGSGVASVECKLDSGLWGACVSPRNYTVADGSHLFQIRVTDRASNQVVRSHSWVSDTANPVLSITSSPSPVTNVSPAEIHFTATDANGIDSYECSANGGAFTVCSSPYSQNVDGSYNVQIRAIDNVGKRSNIETVVFKLDQVIPVISFTTTPGNSTSSTSTGFASAVFNVSDVSSSITSVTCSWDGGSFSPCSAGVNQTQTGLSAGSHSFQVRAVDEAGNIGTAIRTWVQTTHTWSVSAYGACSASPVWSGFSGCTASPFWSSYGACSANPSWSSYSACSASPSWSSWGQCPEPSGSPVSGGYGGVNYGPTTQTRTCSNTSGTQSRSCLGATSGIRTRSCQNTNGVESRSCSGRNGTQTRAVVCERNDGITVTPVAGVNCSESEPVNSQACTEECAGSATRACSRTCSGSSTQACTGSCSGSSTRACSSSCSGSSSQSCLGVRARIQPYYLSHLNRYPDSSGMSFYYNLVVNSGWSYGQVSSEIANGHEAQIIPFYQYHFRRPADTAGQMYWGLQYRHGPLTLQQIRDQGFRQNASCVFDCLP